MRLVSARVAGIGPFDDLSFSFVDDAGAPKNVVVVLGGGGVGKTTLLTAIASTRPGHAVALPRQRGREGRPVVVCDYALGDDEPARPHPLRVASPMAELGESDAAALLRRREQAHFDKQTETGGFVLLGFSAARWFSRSPLLLTSPERTVLRHDARATHVFDDATRADLSRETKQVLTYAGVAAALAPGDSRLVALDAAVRRAVDALLEPLGAAYAGVDPVSLEPTFELGGAVRPFDELPTHARHLVAIAALTVRALAAGYPERDPRACEGVVLLDDAAAHLPDAVAASLPVCLSVALPRVQWVLATASQVVASRVDVGQVIALRRLGGDVEAFEGVDARLH